MGLTDTYRPRIEGALEEIKTALANKGVEVETLKASEVPDRIREIELLKLGDPIIRQQYWIDESIVVGDDINKIKNVVITDIEAPKNVQTADLSKDEQMGVVGWFNEAERTYYISSQRAGVKVVFEGYTSGEIEFYFSEQFLRGSIDVPPLEVIDVGNLKVTGPLYGFFGGFSKLVEVRNLDKMETQNITSIKCLFDYDSLINTIDISSWDLSECTDYESAFEYCKALKSLNLPSSFMSKADSIKGVFSNCSQLSELDLSNSNISAVSATYLLGNVFIHCSNLTKIIAPDWTKQSEYVAQGENVFYNCTSLSNWSASKVSGAYAKPTSEGGYFTPPE